MPVITSHLTVLAVSLAAVVVLAGIVANTGNSQKILLQESQAELLCRQLAAEISAMWRQSDYNATEGVVAANAVKMPLKLGGGDYTIRLAQSAIFVGPEGKEASCSPAVPAQLAGTASGGGIKLVWTRQSSADTIMVSNA